MTQEQRFRVGIYNLQSGVATTKGFWHYLTTAWKYCLPHGSEYIHWAGELTKTENIDIIGLAEIDAGSYRTRQQDQLEVFTNSAKLPYKAFFPTLTMRTAHQGNAVCSRFPALSFHNHKLPGLGEPRFLGQTKIDLGKQKLNFFVTHLSLDRFHRAEQIEAVAAIVDATSGPTILVGDFNVFHHDEMWLLHESRLVMATADATFPSWRPNRALDYIFFSKEFRILQSKTNPAKFSDHLLFWAEVILTD